MKNSILVPLLGAVTLLTLTVARSSAEDGSAVGLWKTIDDKTHETKSIVRLWEVKGELKGKIERIFPEPGEDPDPICDKCPGDKHNKRVIGMEFLWGFRRDRDRWVDGHVLDPDNGKTYHATVRVIDGGRRLRLYGYIKVLIKIGRSQTWERATEADLADEALAPPRLQGAASRGQGE